MTDPKAQDEVKVETVVKAEDATTPTTIDPLDQVPVQQSTTGAGAVSSTSTSTGNANASATSPAPTVTNPSVAASPFHATLTSQQIAQLLNFRSVHTTHIFAKPRVGRVSPAGVWRGCWWTRKGPSKDQMHARIYH